MNLVPFILETTGKQGSHAKKFINYLLRDADNQPIAVRDTWSTIQSVLRSAISKQQFTGSRHVTLGFTVTSSCFIHMVLMVASTGHPGTHTAHISLKTATAVPCGHCSDITSSDGDAHNTGSNFVLLFADIGIMSTLLEGLTDVDVLHIALGCRFVLDIFTISQQYSPALDHEQLPHDPELFLFCSDLT